MPSAERIAAVALEPELVVCQMFARGRFRGVGEGQEFRTGCSLVARKPLDLRFEVDEMVAGGHVVQQELCAAITKRIHTADTEEKAGLSVC